MNYATTASRPNPLAALGAMGVPAAFGAILVIGLAVTVTLPPVDTKTQGFFVPITPEVDPPLPPEVVPETKSNTATVTRVERPAPAPIPTPGITLTGRDPISVGNGIDEGWGTGLEPLGTLPPARPELSIDPVKASPRGNPANWITTADYKTSWIRREYTGTARFALEVSASGKVSNCTITGSTGHEALDRATCRLIQARAVFNPAKGTDGNSVAGSYSSSVNWTIPE